ncbi:hypothetical protein OE88DRAFT_1647787 [Heliocybe sulcata]|uniref:Uncharacterized protein n=1 Tax=Heliocybe sulcata TaxID=5364 RepID=A0A5C3MT87_9AGAM|nr:hypothetical protein OE88DRAFT_1647787 [Heliocybe sulcata]
MCGGTHNSSKTRNRRRIVTGLAGFASSQMDGFLNFRTPLHDPVSRGLRQRDDSVTACDALFGLQLEGVFIIHSLESLREVAGRVTNTWDVQTSLESDRAHVCFCSDEEWNPCFRHEGVIPYGRSIPSAIARRSKPGRACGVVGPTVYLIPTALFDGTRYLPVPGATSVFSSNTDDKCYRHRSVHVISGVWHSLSSKTSGSPGTRALRTMDATGTFLATNTYLAVLLLAAFRGTADLLGITVLCLSLEDTLRSFITYFPVLISRLTFKCGEKFALPFSDVNQCCAGSELVGESCRNRELDN